MKREGGEKANQTSSSRGWTIAGKNAQRKGSIRIVAGRDILEWKASVDRARSAVTRWSSEYDDRWIEQICPAEQNEATWRIPLRRLLESA